MLLRNMLFIKFKIRDYESLQIVSLYIFGNTEIYFCDVFLIFVFLIFFSFIAMKIFLNLKNHVHYTANLT